MAGLATGNAPTSTGFSLLPSEGVDPNNGPGVGNPAGGAGGRGGASSEAQGVLPVATSSQMNILPSASPTNSFSSLSSPKVLVFNDKTNFGPNNTGRVFSTQNQTKTFAWTYAKTNTTLLDIFWYGRQVNTGDAFDVSHASVIAHARFGDTTPGNEFAKLNPSDAMLNLTDPGLSSGEWYTREMVIKIDWKTQSGDEGFTQSGVFTVANGPFDSEAFDREATDNDQDKQGGEATTSIGNLSRPTSGASDPGNGIAGGSSRGGGGGGLSTGAIAGIAVACSVVGILLLAGLAWFLLRRRRRRHFDGGYNAAHQTTSSFVAVKEAQPSVVESPIAPPFSDNDNNDRGIGPHAGSGALSIPLQYAPGTNAADDPVSPQDDRRPSTAASGNRSRNIAHLVEEGMTEADILRLEEEERHLDAEIARAARRTSS